MSEYKSGKVLGSILEGAIEVMRDRATGAKRPVPLRLFADPDRPAHHGPVVWEEAERDLGGGLWPGFWILVGATGTGKTQLALSLALGAAMEGCPVAYIGLELGSVDLVARLLGLGARYPWSGLYLGRKKNRLGDPSVDDQQVRKVAAGLEGLPFLAVEGDPMGWGPDKLKGVVADLARLAEERGINTETHPPFVVLDFLQLMGDPKPAEGERPRPLDVRNRIQLASYQARAMARDYGVAILAVSSTSRENSLKLTKSDKTTKSGLPKPHTLVGTGKESGEIEYSADGVFVLVPHEYNPDGERAVSVARAKLRAGRTGWWHLRFDGHRHRTSTAEEVAQAEGRPVGEPDDLPFGDEDIGTPVADPDAPRTYYVAKADGSMFVGVHGEQPEGEGLRPRRPDEKGSL